MRNSVDGRGNKRSSQTNIEQKQDKVFVIMAPNLKEMKVRPNGDLILFVLIINIIHNCQSKDNDDQIEEHYLTKFWWLARG